MLFIVGFIVALFIITLFNMYLTWKQTIYYAENSTGICWIYLGYDGDRYILMSTYHGGVKTYTPDEFKLGFTKQEKRSIFNKNK